MSRIIQTFVMLFLVVINSAFAANITSASPGIVAPGQTTILTVENLDSPNNGLIVQFKTTFDEEPVNAQIITVKKLSASGKFNITVLVPYLSATISVPGTISVCVGNADCSSNFTFNYLPPTNAGITSIFPSIVTGNDPVDLFIKGVNLQQTANRFTIFGSNHFSCTNQVQPTSYTPESDIVGSLFYNDLNLFFICSQSTQKLDVTLPTSSPSVYSPPGYLLYIDPNSVSEIVTIDSAIVESRNNRFVLVISGSGFNQVKSFKIRFSNNLFINAKNFNVSRHDQLDRVVISLPSDLFDSSAEGIVAARDQEGLYSNVANITQPE